MGFGEKIINWKRVTTPDFIVGAKDNPYLLRWHLIPRNPFLNIYLHCFKTSDQNREMHCHSWPSLSIILDGIYSDLTERGHTIHKKGDWIFRLNGNVPHRIELIDGFAWTLFFTGPRYREWGFWCRDGKGGKRFVPWQEYTDRRDSGLPGAGCGQ
jgi:hypothetical protein